MAKFTVDRQKWYRGSSAGSKLLRQDGSRCCIGFVGEQCGFADEDILNKECAFEVKSGKWPKWFFEPWHDSVQQTDDLMYAYDTNDDGGISDSEREARLKEIFAKNGDEIEFVN